MNPLLQAINKMKMQQILGFLPVDIYLDIIWEQISDILGYNPIESETTERYNGNNSTVLYLNRRPITQVAEVKINNKVVEEEDYIVNESYIEFVERCLVAYKKKCDWDTLYHYCITDEIEVKYTAGYKCDEIPSKIIYAATMLYKLNVDNVGSKSSLSSYKIDTISYGYKDTSERMDEVNNVLNDFKVVVI